jgi:putative transposase
MGKSKQAIQKRSKKESWQSIAGNGKGGDHIKYPLQALPQDIQLAIYNKEGAPPELIPHLAPAVALAALERPADAPTFAQIMPPARGRRARALQRPLPDQEPVPSLPAPFHNNKDASANQIVVDNKLVCSSDHHLPTSTAAPAVAVAPVAPHNNKDTTPIDILTPPGLSPARRYAYEDMPAWSPERAISGSALKNPRVARILAILREVEARPRDWRKGKDAWVRGVAARHDVARQTVYRWLAKYDKRGIAGIEHRKATAGRAKVWTPEALDFWIGLTLKPSQRKMTLKALYDDCLIIEAQRRGWNIGAYASALWWYEKKATPGLRAMRDGGMRALDNLLPPTLRDYSDMAPFEMLVGDQHRWDFWVVDDDTGQVFRPECYLWQDLRTRVLYGAAFDRHYDAHLCGEALRIGMQIYGVFNAIYTDNGSAEISKYIMGILAEIRALGMEWQQTLDTPMDVLDVDGEEVQPVVQPIAPGTHKRAIVKNAKAKMIEKTFDILEEILRSKFRVPGSVKRLGDDIHVQDVDQQEALRLAAEGKLLTAGEFALTVYRAMDHYNRAKAHRGVRREWVWRPKPATATPYDCLKACYGDGWRPRAISDEAADMIFLRRIKRTVQLGRITIEGELYEHDALLGLQRGRPVECRIRPFERDVALVYLDGKYLCAARPVEYSSMKDADLATRKILEKREKRRTIADSFRAIIRNIPDLREYSQVPEAERVAALVGEEKKRIEAARANQARALAPEELAAKVTELEALNERLPDGRTRAFAMSAASKPLPPRPDFWISNADRFLWCIQCEAAAGELLAEDRAFMEAEMAAMTPDQRERWEFERAYGQ